MTPHEMRRAPGLPAQSSCEEATSNLNNLIPILPSRTDASEACDAFVVLLLTPTGKFTRRTYLSLHAAERAYKRAQAAKKPARLVLCRLLPVMPGDLDGRWRE